jgi:Pyridoxamine 5'-phosphate oxidase
MASFSFPPEVRAVIEEFRTCELTTFAKDGAPITWPTVPFYDPERGIFIVTTSIALAQKAFNVRRNPRVALLFSDPTASGLANPPAVLIQGDAVAPDRIETTITPDVADGIARLLRRQRSNPLFGSNLLTRSLFDWYFMRLRIEITPRRVRWWPNGDLAAHPYELEAGNVA